MGLNKGGGEIGSHLPYYHTWVAPPRDLKEKIYMAKTVETNS